MGQKFRNLLPLITADQNMRLAYAQTARGKRDTFGYLEFKEFAEANLAVLRDELLAGTYRQGEFRRFMVRDPKPREISALPFRDRLAQHALCNVIEPIFERVFVTQSYACRRGRGTHSGAVRAQALMRHIGLSGAPVYCLKMDFSGYFRNIDRARLHQMIRRKISCRSTLALIEQITPPTGVGLPIGSLTSQLWANIYGTEFDRFLLRRGFHDFVRYMDDTVVFSTSATELRALKDEAGQFAADTLGLRFSKWSVAPVTRGVNFLGYRIWPTHKLLRRQSVVRARRKIAAFVERGDTLALDRFLASWRGHAQWADSHNLNTRLERIIRP